LGSTTQHAEQQF